MEKRGEITKKREPLAREGQASAEKQAEGLHGVVIGKSGRRIQLWQNGAQTDGAPRKSFFALPTLLYAEHCLTGSLSGAEERFFSFYKQEAEKRGEAELLLVMADLSKRYENLDFFALGERGVRGLLAAPALFLTQLKAALRASALARVAICLPFVSDANEIAAVRALLEEAMRELLVRGEPFDELCELGAVVETPAAALSAQQIATELDFLLIDTDPLASFLLASSSPEEVILSSNSARDALFSLIEQALAGAHERGRFVCVTGRLATSAPFALRLLDLGADALALPQEALLRMRNLIKSRI